MDFKRITPIFKWLKSVSLKASLQDEANFKVRSNNQGNVEVRGEKSMQRNISVCRDFQQIEEKKHVHKITLTWSSQISKKSRHKRFLIFFYLCLGTACSWRNRTGRTRGRGDLLFDATTRRLFRVIATALTTAAVHFRCGRRFLEGVCEEKEFEVRSFFKFQKFPKYC